MIGSAPIHAAPGYHGGDDRPSKRARSEAPFSGGALQSQSRPATSYVPSNECVSRAVFTSHEAARRPVFTFPATTKTDFERPATPAEPPFDPAHTVETVEAQGVAKTAMCAGCEMIPNSLRENQVEETSWISCDGCNAWYHYACAGLTEREVRSVDKFSCPKCWSTHGPTTYLRKSARAHTSIDYAGLNEGIVKTSDESPCHPYIKPIKERTIKFLPESFPRMRPELITLDIFEQGNGWKEPILVPAWMNPSREPIPNELVEGPPDFSRLAVEAWLQEEYDTSYVPDEGQDALGMVIPQHLTVRRVAELYGPLEKVPVIDVKSQGEAGSWNMQKWADYYESKEKKYIRNVISLEISYSKLGRLVKRPKVVQQLDLVDSVWPAELKAKGEFPRVQLYCLMSIADSYTDFHIDFGGSSVFYHIIKGKKTFLFIPPKSKHLKKYEQWCLSPAQNETFLPDQTKECYRVDLSAGDTMLIPSGWIHAVWTPEDSLVIGGNFLTRLHFGMQIQIAEIEKTTKVPRRFRQPHFQRILWFTAIRHLADDPIPSAVEDALQAGGEFTRDIPGYNEFEAWGANSKPGADNYQARYYSQYELEGLPHLARYLLRNALITMDLITDGITADTRAAVTRAIPKGHGQPLEIVKKFAVWSAWKRGNEQIPEWAYPDAVPGVGVPGAGEKKLTAAAMRKLDRQAAVKTRVVPARQSVRKEVSSTASVQAVETDAGKEPNGVIIADAEVNPGPAKSTQVKLEKASRKRSLGSDVETPSSIPGTGLKRIACDTCRKRRTRCDHKESGSPVVVQNSAKQPDAARCEEKHGLQRLSEVQEDDLANSDVTPSAKRGPGCDVEVRAMKKLKVEEDLVPFAAQVAPSQSPGSAEPVPAESVPTGTLLQAEEVVGRYVEDTHVSDAVQEASESVANDTLRSPSQPSEVVEDEVQLVATSPKLIPVVEICTGKSSASEETATPDAAKSEPPGAPSPEAQNEDFTTRPLSPPSSPLSDVDSPSPSSKPATTQVSPRDHSRRSNRASKPVMPFLIESPTPVKEKKSAPASTSKKRTLIQTPPVSLVNGKSTSPEADKPRPRRRSGAAVRLTSPAKASVSQSKSKSKSPTKAATLSTTGVGSKAGEADDAEEESLRLAKQLAFGLRRSSARPSL
ncbi:MAG: JmjC domain-containing histone demethylation protein 1 [Thelocarpon impressellum]|nr:MAG: JmjC domain-containing histone demethylation protein 1 [Thelocarpon impressellum]